MKNIQPGNRYNRLEFVGYTNKKIGKNPIGEWLCECGTKKELVNNLVYNLRVKSCGCSIPAVGNKKRGRGHGMRNTRIYGIWIAMRKRCINPIGRNKRWYGHKSLQICDEWKNDFIAFYEWATKNGYSDNLTIDRINNDLGYSPDNCRWADDFTQVHNRSNTFKIHIDGKDVSLGIYLRSIGRSQDHRLIYRRITKHGWNPLDAINKPKFGWQARKKQ